MSSNLRLGLYFIAASLVLDVFDGLAARALNAASPIGKDLDSLSDLVSFGVAPAILFSQLATSPDPWLYGGLCFYIACGAVRLAKFNNMESSADFIGLAIPGAAMLLMSLIILSINDALVFNHIYQFLAYVIAGSLMIIPLKMFSLKALGYKDYRRFLLLAVAIISVVCFIIKPSWALFVGLISYVILSVVYQLISLNVKNRV